MDGIPANRALLKYKVDRYNKSIGKQFYGRLSPVFPAVVQQVFFALDIGDVDNFHTGIVVGRPPSGQASPVQAQTYPDSGLPGNESIVPVHVSQDFIDGFSGYLDEFKMHGCAIAQSVGAHHGCVGHPVAVAYIKFKFHEFT